MQYIEQQHAASGSHRGHLQCVSDHKCARTQTHTRVLFHHKRWICREFIIYNWECALPFMKIGWQKTRTMETMKKKDFMNYKLVNLNQFRWVLYTQNMKVFSPFGWLIIYFYWCNTLELEFNALNVAFVLRKLKHFAAKNKSDTMKNDIRSLRNQFRFETHHKMCTNTPTLCKCSNKAITILVCLCVCEMKIEYAAVATELTACNFRIGAGNMYY